MQKECQTNATMITICHCQHCNGPIEFEAETWTYGELKTCPKCGNETKTFLPARRGRGFNPPTANNADLTVGLIYLGAIVLPVVGFFGGIYLLATKQPGHGAITMGLSVVMTFIWLSVVSLF